MSYEFEGERECETEVAPDIGPLRNSRSTTIALYVLLALIGSGAAFLWHGYDSALEGLPIFKSETAPQAVSLKSFDDFQRVVTENLQRYDEILRDQDAVVKQLTDQVLHLNTRMDSLESRARDAQAAIPAAPKEAPKKPAAKPPAFTGGVPLPPVREEKQ